MPYMCKSALIPRPNESRGESEWWSTLHWLWKPFLTTQGRCLFITQPNKPSSSLSLSLFWNLWIVLGQVILGCLEETRIRHRQFQDSTRRSNRARPPQPPPSRSLSSPGEATRSCRRDSRSPPGGVGSRRLELERHCARRTSWGAFAVGSRWSVCTHRRTRESCQCGGGVADR